MCYGFIIFKFYTCVPDKLKLVVCRQMSGSWGLLLQVAMSARSDARIVCAGVVGSVENKIGLKFG